MVIDFELMVDLFQAIILYINGTEQWRVNIFQIPQASELVLNNGLLAFIQHVSNILCLHLMFQRLECPSPFCSYNNNLPSWLLINLWKFPGHGCNKEQHMQERVIVPLSRGCCHILCFSLSLFLGFLNSSCILGVWKLLVHLH